MSESVYTAEIKQSLTGRPDARFVWLCNFEVENEWAHNYVGLPVPRLSTTTSTVQRMEELGALIAEPIDYLLLGKGLDEEYRRYVERLGLGLPTELVSQERVPDATTSQSVLGSHKLLRQLSELAEQGTFLMPMGASAEEQKITDATGLRMAVPDAGTFERVNSKIYSRRLVEELGLRAIPGYACETVEELRDALGDGPSKEQSMIVKDAFGVSGKGLVVLDSPTKVQRLLRMVDQRARRTGIEALHVVVERFLASGSTSTTSSQSTETVGCVSRSLRRLSPSVACTRGTSCRLLSPPLSTRRSQRAPRGSANGCTRTGSSGSSGWTLCWVPTTLCTRCWRSTRG